MYFSGDEDPKDDLVIDYIFYNEDLDESLYEIPSQWKKCECVEGSDSTEHGAVNVPAGQSPEKKTVSCVEVCGNLLDEVNA